MLTQSSVIIAIIACFLPFFIYYLTGCSYNECCSKQWINETLGVSKIVPHLSQKLFGQHLVIEKLPRLIQAHLNKNQPDKPLVLSFHGTTGVGKNYVSTLLSELIYKEGPRSQYVHLFVSRKHFPHKDKLEEYKSQIGKWITGNVSACPRSLFIFDEANDLPAGFFDSIKPFLDSYPQLGRVDYRRSIFIFLSNAGTETINKFTLQHIHSGRSRNDIKLEDIEGALRKSVFDENGGFLHTKLIEHNLVSAFIPFLPLQREHVRECIKKYILDNYPTSNVDKMTEKVISQLEFAPESNPIFSRVGCRQVPEKTDQVMEDF